MNVNFHNLRRWAIHERWWFWTWTIWGLIVAGIVYGIDHSKVASLTWLIAGLAAGIFGQALWERLITSLCRNSSGNLFRIESNSEIDHNLENPGLAWYTQCLLRLANPSRKPWEIYASGVFGVGSFHGLLLGAVCGSLMPLFGFESWTSFQGACLGAIVGPMFACALYAVIFTVLFARSFRGPSIEPVKSTVWLATEEADQLGHERVTGSHLLLAILRQPTGSAAALLEGNDALRQRGANYLWNQLADEEPRAEEFRDGAGVFAVLQEATKEAKALRHKQVDQSHLLLAMLNLISETTIDVLKKAGIADQHLRERIIQCIKA